MDAPLVFVISGDFYDRNGRYSFFYSLLPAADVLSPLEEVIFCCKFL